MVAEAQPPLVFRNNVPAPRANGGAGGEGGAPFGHVKAGNGLFVSTRTPSSGFLTRSSAAEGAHAGHADAAASLADDAMMDVEEGAKQGSGGHADEDQEDDDDDLDSRSRTIRAASSQATKAASDALGLTRDAMSGPSNALVIFSAGSTLLPQQIAELVTSVSLLARVSLKSTAFFIELMLEAAKYSTGMGLGLTRRALISAIGTARAVHALRSGEDWNPQRLAIENGAPPRDSAFLAVLDRWTSLGIYVVHHSFTMAELFAMSGFYLVDQGLKAGVSAADESVRLIDGIFGSNETSRALSGFIGLVRRELTEDAHFRQLGAVRSLAALTKAFTTFAVLQNATYRRSAASHKTRVLYDCTVLGEAETKSWRAMLVGPSNFAKRPVDDGPSSEDARLGLLPDIPSRSSSSGGAPPATHRLPSSASVRSSRSFATGEPCLTDFRHAPDAQGRSKSGAQASGGGASGRARSSSSSSSVAMPSSDALEEELTLLDEIDRIIGSDDEDVEEVHEGGGEAAASRKSSARPGRSPVRSSQTVAMRKEELPARMQQAIRQADADELQRGLVVEQRSSSNNAHRPRDVRRIVRRRAAGGHEGAREEVYEVITETIELVEETTTTTTTTTMDANASTAQESPVVKRKGGSDRYRRGLIPFSALHLGGNGGDSGGSGGVEGEAGGRKVTRTRDSRHSHADSTTETVGDFGRERTLSTEDEWLEVTRTMPSVAGVGDSSSMTASATEPYNLDEIPELPNGAPVPKRSSIATLSRQESLVRSPEEGRQRMQVVLKTMTRKLIQRRRIVRRVDAAAEADGIDELEEDEVASDVDLGVPVPDGTTTPTGTGRSKRGGAGQPRGDDSSSSSVISATTHEREHREAGPQSNHLHKALQKAKPSFLSPPHWKPRSSSSGGSSSSPAPKSPRQHRGDGGGEAGTSPSSATTPPSTPPRKDNSLRSVHKTLPEPPTSSRPPPEAKRKPSSTSSSAAPRHHSETPAAMGPAPPPKDRTSRFRTPKRRARNGSISSMHSFSSAVTQTHVTSHATSTGADGATGGFGPDDGDAGGGGVAPDAFPRQHLVKNLHTFMRHSSAAYGQAIMRILGLAEGEYLFGDTKKHHGNVYSYAHHVGLPLDNILLSSYAEEGRLPFHTEKMAPIVNYVSVDDEAKAVILACRGTMGLSDVLTDLTCEYEAIEVEGGKPDGAYRVHSGMMASARRLADESSVVLQTLRQALRQRPDYGLVLTGHSLGGGVAALLAMLWASPSGTFKANVLRRTNALASSTSSGKAAPRHPPITTPFVTSLDGSLGVPGRPIKVYAYGVPCVSSIDLSVWARGLVVSVVHGHDLVCALSLGFVRDLRAVATSLSDEREGDLAQEIVGRYVGLYQRRRRHARVADARGGAGAISGDGVATDASGYDVEGGESDVPMGFAAAAGGDWEAAAATGMTPRPPEVPAHEREMTLDLGELRQGKSRNRAREAGYQDPHLSKQPPTRPGEVGSANAAPAAAAAAAAQAGAYPAEEKEIDPDEELANWMWSLIRTMRADMQNEKLYPPGQVFSIESFDIFVTPRMGGGGGPGERGDQQQGPSSSSVAMMYTRGQDAEGPHAQAEGASAAAARSQFNKAQAHRVLLRECCDVEAKFREPVFSKTMMRDHIPTNYSHCIELLCEAVLR